MQMISTRKFIRMKSYKVHTYSLQWKYGKDGM